VYLKQVLTEVSLPCTCLESFGSPVILSSSFLCPYPNLPSFADKKDKFYQHTTMKERFRTSAQKSNVWWLRTRLLPIVRHILFFTWPKSKIVWVTFLRKFIFQKRWNNYWYINFILDQLVILDYTGHSKKKLGEARKRLFTMYTYMTVTTCPKGKLKNWFSLHMDYIVRVAGET